MSIANNPQPTPDRQAFAEEFVRSLMERYAQYHEHKENMAYGGLTVFAGAVVAALVSDSWPPKWGLYTPTLAPGAALALFLVTLKYLEFQMHRRRWAALRVAGCEHVLAKWVQGAPTSEDLTPKVPAVAERIGRVRRLVDGLWPPEANVRAVDTGIVRIGNDDVVIYPTALVDAWQNAKTSTRVHERIFFGIAWILGVALFIHSWSCPCTFPLLNWLTSAWS
ncbi:MAG TPA: hypothetical protein VFP64_11830 [Pyrinomonadaceae bacterium]|nr:hypothetical protein [Pyrinomonadaceae bacterium]